MPRRPRSLTDHDRAAWHAYAREVRLLPGKTPVEPPPMAAALPPSPPRPPQRQVPQAPARQPAFTLITGMQPAGLDRASWSRFHGGRMPATRTLDLHGKTAQAAFHALERFLHNAAADHVRCVEIITGRGTGETGGVIRRELPLWLNLPALRPLILAAAHPHALNPGSTRLLLRRVRDGGKAWGPPPRLP